MKGVCVCEQDPPCPEGGQGLQKPWKINLQIFIGVPRGDPYTLGHGFGY